MVFDEYYLNDIELVIFDLDGTLINPSSSWRYLHEKLGTWNEAKENSDLFYSGKLTWEEWAKKDARLWSGVDVNDVRRIAQNCPLTNGAKSTVFKLKEEGFSIAIISGGISFFADRIGQEFKIPYVFSNELHEKDGILTGDVTVQVTSTNKSKIFLNLLRRLGISRKQTVAVGDDFTMIPLFKIVGLAIAFNPIDGDIEKNAHVAVNSPVLLDILPYVLKNRK